MSERAFPAMHRWRDRNGMHREEWASGLTKREWFAGMALQAVIAAGEPSPGTGTTFDMMAQDAFRFADAMIEASKETGDAV